MKSLGYLRDPMKDCLELNQDKDTVVTQDRMIDVRNTLDTKVLRGSVIELKDYFTDCPSVFRLDNKWYMYFLAISKDTKVSGYETHVAVSDDLLNWSYLGPILKRDESRNWDSKQIAGYAALYDTCIGRGCRLNRYQDNYWVSYLGGFKDGYEPDPLSIGIAKSKNPTDCKSFIRSDEPILSPCDPDCREYETKTLYKSTIIFDDNKITSHRFVMFYNAKGFDNKERIYSAVSDDLIHWKRFGKKPVIDDVTNNPDCYITADPMILKDKDGLYIMNFMKYDKQHSAHDTFACSYDLLNWTEWTGEPTIAPDKNNPDQDLFAHKPWIITWQGHVYHFYCACSKNNRRYIALATDF